MLQRQKKVKWVLAHESAKNPKYLTNVTKTTKKPKLTPGTVSRWTEFVVVKSVGGRWLCVLYTPAREWSLKLSVYNCKDPAASPSNRAHVELFMKTLKFVANHRFQPSAFQHLYTKMANWLDGKGGESCVRVELRFQVILEILSEIFFSNQIKVSGNQIEYDAGTF